MKDTKLDKTYVFCCKPSSFYTHTGKSFPEEQIYLMELSDGVFFTKREMETGTILCLGVNLMSFKKEK